MTSCHAIAVIAGSGGGATNVSYHMNMYPDGVSHSGQSPCPLWMIVGPLVCPLSSTAYFRGGATVHYLWTVLLSAYCGGDGNAHYAVYCKGGVTVHNCLLSRRCYYSLLLIVGEVLGPARPLELFLSSSALYVDFYILIMKYCSMSPILA